MLSESQTKNRYGAKFFIGSLVKIVHPFKYYENDLGKCGVVDGISGSIETGFEYSLGPSQSHIRAWFKEDQLDFADSEEKKEYEHNRHFVSAASELYECLREAVMYHCGEDPMADCENKCCGNPACLSERTTCMVEKWRKAIAKAAGETEEKETK